jgi:hypothetical protein
VKLLPGPNTRRYCNRKAIAARAIDLNPTATLYAVGAGDLHALHSRRHRSSSASRCSLRILGGNRQHAMNWQHALDEPGSHIQPLALAAVEEFRIRWAVH